MKNITINGREKTAQLEKELSLKDGALVLLKYNGIVKRVYMVVSFRDNENRYKGNDITPYCTLVNLDTGVYAFEGRCNRETTVRRVLHHILSLGELSHYYNHLIPSKPCGPYDVEVKYSDEFKIDISI